MSTTGSVRLPFLPSKTLTTIDYAPSERGPSLFSVPENTAYPCDRLPLEERFCDPFDLMGEDDRRGDHPSQNTMDSSTIGVHHEQNITPSDLHPDDSSTTNADQAGHDDSNASINLPPLPDNDDSSLFLPGSEDGDQERVDNQTFLEEKEMRKKLMDMESSFLPEPSTIEVAAGNPVAGADDTYFVGASNEGAPESTDPDHSQQPPFATQIKSSYDITSSNDQVPNMGAGADTSSHLDITPAAHSERQEASISETIPSSPTPARTEHPAQSMLPADGTAETSQVSQDQSLIKLPAPAADQFFSSEPHRNRDSLQGSALAASKLFSHSGGTDEDSASRTSSRRSHRPKYLTSRQSVNRLSYSSVASGNTEAANSDATLGADYALQSGGAAPGSANNGQLQNNLARSVSLGSLASGVSGYSEENSIDKRNMSGSMEAGLHTLNEEGSSESHPDHQQQQDEQQQGQSQEPAFESASGPATPVAKPQEDAAFPTDTALAERVKDVQVPSSFVKQFREDHGNRGVSPSKRTGATPAFARSGRTMTLKEQSSTIDRLSKENFDLKMRIHFLNEALNRRSEEGIKEMISENVELKSDKLKLQKDIQGLKKKMREQEKQLKDQQSDKDDPESARSDGDDRDGVHDEEMLYLRERMETYEFEIERLRSESMARESEKRRLAEMMKSLSDGRPMGEAREERDMWKDILETETAAREQAEEDKKILQDENLRLKGELDLAMAPTRPGQRNHISSMLSYSGMSDREHSRHMAPSSSSSDTLVMEIQLLRQENAELRKKVSAQTSMLTSRNREKECLYQEIEELKLGQRRDGSRSGAGDSIFDRTARPSSRASDWTGPSPGDGAELEDLELRCGHLRDQVSGLKLENQSLRSQLEDYITEFEALDRAYQADVDQADEEISNLQQERDQALQMADERDAAFQDLRAEAQEELDALGEELDQKVEECQRQGEDLRNQDENLRALQAEMHAASEGIFRLEEDAQNNLQRYTVVQQELDDCNREMQSLEKNLYESNSKVQRLTVQIESSQNEIAFLREEQDGDKIKIGDLESELKNYEMSLQSEKDKVRELEARLVDERHQREIVGSKEKQELQRIMNELNREASVSKEEVRKLRKGLSAQEIETNTWRDRLMDLENNLRETLGDLSGSRSSMISNIMKLQKELESTALELESVRSKLDEKQSLLRSRDALLESHGLESRKLTELLDRERHARRADKQSFEQALKSHHHASRTITQNNSRISELESARNQERKRYIGLEQQFKGQLNERNAMLLGLWKRLSSMCGPDWAHSNSLINGNLPSQEVIGNILFWPGFSRNLLLAVKTVENVILGFKSRIKGVERDLSKQYQNVEHALSLRIKKLDHMEESMLNMRAQQHTRNLSDLSPEIAKLRGENRLLKAELNLIQSHSRSRRAGSVAAVTEPTSPTRTLSIEAGANSEWAALARHHSLAEKETGALTPRADRGSTGIPQPSHVSSSTTLAKNADTVVHGSRSQHGLSNSTSHEKWTQRLHELEKRLKAEREARLLDRNGARRRLEERDAENKKLRAQLDQHFARKDLTGGNPSQALPRLPQRSNSSRHRDESSSEGEGIYVDIEV